MNHDLCHHEMRIADSEVPQSFWETGFGASNLGTRVFVCVLRYPIWEQVRDIRELKTGNTQTNTITLLYPFVHEKDPERGAMHENWTDLHQITLRVLV